MDRGPEHARQRNDFHSAASGPELTTMTPSVLVVDDEIAMRAALEANFRRQGWTVRSAKGKNEAIELFRSYPVPLVITDIRMPDGTGLDVVKGVRSITPNARVILLTAFGSVQDAVAAMKEGASDYLIKPVSFEELQRVAREVLNGPQETTSGPAECRLVGNSPRFRALLERARQAAQSDADILIEAA